MEYKRTENMEKLWQVDDSCLENRTS